MLSDVLKAKVSSTPAAGTLSEHNRLRYVAVQSYLTKLQRGGKLIAFSEAVAKEVFRQQSAAWSGDQFVFGLIYTSWICICLQLSEGNTKRWHSVSMMPLSNVGHLCLNCAWWEFVLCRWRYFICMDSPKASPVTQERKGKIFNGFQAPLQMPRAPFNDSWAERSPICYWNHYPRQEWWRLVASIPFARQKQSKFTQEPPTLTVLKNRRQCQCSKSYIVNLSQSSFLTTISILEYLLSDALNANKMNLNHGGSNQTMIWLVWTWRLSSGANIVFSSGHYNAGVSKGCWIRLRQQYRYYRS